jgi:DNA-binding MarR family transcriptional regulator
MSGKLAAEIKQTKPFGSLEEEAILNLHRTSSILLQVEAEALKPHGLSLTQYNALRILRGSGPKGLACQEIGERMITRDPDVTRLLDRLEKANLISRARSSEDRRVVMTRITGAGLKLLASLDGVLKDMPRKILGHLGEKQLRALVDLLEEARSGKGE